MKFPLVILVILYSSALVAQDTLDHDHKEHHDHSSHHKHHDDALHHDHHKNEIGIANSIVSSGGTNNLVYGLHIHYVYTLKNNKFGIGLGFESLFDQDKHRTFGVLGSFRPIEKWSLILSPGITFEDAGDIFFSLHIETAYEFEIHNFHIGPVLEYAYDPEDYHISAGIHLGYGF